MNKTSHFFCNSIYLVSSHATARNPIFYNEKLCNRFLSKINDYLGPIAEILQYRINNSSFQLLVKLKDRRVICDHFKKKKGIHASLCQNELPLSTFIFSKAMNDLLVSTAKHFNYHHKRKGSLFAGRFQRKLIESEVQLEMAVKEMEDAKSKSFNHGEWAMVPLAYTIKKQNKVLSKQKERCGGYYYKKGQSEHQILKSFRLVDSLDRRGSFAHLPPKSIYQRFKRISILYFVPLNTS